MENDFDIKSLTAFKIGGKISKLFCPTNIDEFVKLLDSEPNAKVLGNLSNTLASSNGYDGTVILTTKMNNVIVNGNKIIADCGIKGPKLSQIALENGLTGFEFMIGFPGSLGGNVYMNASAQGQCISDNLICVNCYDRKYTKNELEFSYRHSLCQDKKLIVLNAEFELQKADKIEIQRKMNDNLEFRKTHQPLLNQANCGSVFKNPQSDSAGRLLDTVGAKDLTVGGAKVWENHANFIINYNNATSTDVLQLMDKMSTKVEQQYGIKLIPEIKYLGNNEYEEKLCKKLKIELV